MFTHIFEQEVKKRNSILSLRFTFLFNFVNLTKTFDLKKNLLLTSMRVKRQKFKQYFARERERDEKMTIFCSPSRDWGCGEVGLLMTTLYWYYRLTPIKKCIFILFVCKKAKTNAISRSCNESYSLYYCYNCISLFDSILCLECTRLSSSSKVQPFASRRKNFCISG